MAGNSKPLSNSQPAIGALQVQTSAHGQAAALFWGRVRVPPNLLWYDDFKAIPRTETQGGGGKGGGAKQTTTTYSYQAAVVMALGVGPVNAVLSAWRAKDRIYGASTSTRIRTLRHQATVPGGGVVTPPESASFFRNVAVRHLANDTAGKGVGSAHAGVLVQGVDYTVAGGSYTLVAAWEGLQVEIEYQIEEAVAGSSALGQLGLGLATGVHSQPVWAHLTSNHSAKALAYPGLAYLYGATFSLDSNAQVPNHTFEVSTPSEFSATIPDADMSRVVEEFLTDGLRGVQWPAARLGDLTEFRNYTRAWGLFMSPALLEQERAADTLKRWLKLCNADCTWSGLKLKVLPLGDEDKTANGATYTANITPVYDLTTADFLIDGDEPRITVSPRVNEDAYNHVRVEYQNRDNGYAIEVMSAKDLAHIEQFGERTMEVIKAHEVKTAAVASFVAHIELQRQMAIWNTYRFKLPWQKGRLEPLDLVTLTDPDLYLARVPVRITRITEGTDDFTVEAEDCPFGHASAPLYGAQAGDGYAPDFNAPPGDALAPVIFELPGLLTASGLELAVATAGATPAWGGCRVWVSFDEVNYKEVAELRGSSRFGTLTAPVSTTLALQLAAGQLVTASAEDAAALSTLLFVGGSSPEYLAYQTATLTGPGAYTLGGLERGAYGSTPDAHAIGDPVVRVDTAIARSGPLDPALIGTTVHLKLTSFNVFGGAEQSLADVTAIPYTITGDFVTGGNGGAELLILKSTGFAFIFPSSAATSSDSPTIEFTAEIINIVGTVTFEATAYDAANAVIGTVGGVTLTDITATSCKLTAANFNALGATTVRYVKVTASLGALSDTMTIYRGDDGGDALNLVLDNEAHVVPTAADGESGNYSGASTGVRVFEGITDVTALWTFAISATNATGTINGGAGPVGPGVGAVTVACSAISAGVDRGAIAITATRAGFPDQSKVFSLAKSKAGTPGADGEDGAPAQILHLTATGFAFVFDDENATTSSSPTISLTANLQNVIGTADFVATAYNAAGTSLGTVALGGSGNTRTLSAAQFVTHANTRYVTVVATLGALSDSTTIYRGDQGSDAIQAVLSNEAHTIPTASDGSAGNYAGSGTTLRVFQGVTELTYDGVGTAAGSWTATVTGSSITRGSLTDSGAHLTVGDHSAMTADTATVTFAISGKTLTGAAFSFTKLQTLSKSKAGPSGRSVHCYTDIGTQVFTLNGTGTGVNESSGIQPRRTLSGFNGTGTTVWSVVNGSFTGATTTLSETDGRMATVTYDEMGSDAVTFRCTYTEGSNSAYDDITLYRLKDGVGSYLTNESHTLPASNAGVVSSYSGATGTFKVTDGGRDVSTTRLTFSVLTYSGFTGGGGISINSSGVYTVSSGIQDASDVATVTLRCVYTPLLGPAVTMDRIFTITKAKQGATGSTGGTGSAGTRGSLNLYISGSSPLTSAECDAAVLAASGAAAKVIGDTVTESNGSTYVASLRWNGSSWVAPGTVIDGSLLVNGSVAAISLAAASVTAEKITSSTTPTNGIAFALGSSATVAGYSAAGAFISSTNGRYGLLVANTTNQSGAGGIAVGVTNGSSYAGTFVNTNDSAFTQIRCSVNLAQNQRAGEFINYQGNYSSKDSEVWLCENANAIEIKTGMFRYDRTLEAASGGAANFVAQKPGGAQSNVWLRINVNGTDHLIPVWPAA